MGIVVTFPQIRRATRAPVGGQGSATIIILPVVRVERPNDSPSGDVSDGSGTSGRKRRRRVSRS
jgi:hypothetical protein